MRIYRFTKALCITVSLILISGGVAFGFPNFLTDLNTQYGTSLSCDVCHPYTANYGADYLSAYISNGGSSVAAFQTIEPLDSDNDGFSNIEEFSAGTNPSDATSFPVVSTDTTPPTIMIASPQAATYHSSSIPLEYTISDGSLELFLDNNLLSTPPAGVLTGLSIGKHTLRVQATDTAGNVGSSEVVFTLQAGLLTSIPDLNGNSSDDLACLSVNDNGGVRVVVRDSLSREKLSVLHFPGRFAPLAMTMVPDLDGNSVAELAVLGTDVNGTVRVTIKDSVSDALVNAINFPSRFSPISFSTLPDLNGNGVPEIAVLGVDNSGKIRVIIKDAETRANINTLSFPSGITPVSMTSISDLDGNGVPELAVLWIGEFGKVGVMMKDPSTRSQVNVVYFPPRFMPTGLAAIPDFDGSGNPELAVMGTDDQGSTRIFVKDSISRDMIQTIVLPAQLDSMSMTVVANMGDTNAPEIATLQVDVDGLIRALVMDSQSSNKLTSVLFDRGSSPLPPNGESTLQCTMRCLSWC